MLTHLSNNWFLCPTGKYYLLSYNPATYKKLLIKAPDWSTKNIMIVEDDETNAYSIKSVSKKNKSYDYRGQRWKKSC